MEFCFALPPRGPLATPENIATHAQQGEIIGFGTLFRVSWRCQWTVLRFRRVAGGVSGADRAAKLFSQAYVRC